MKQSDSNCPRCGRAIPNNVLYQCARCFSKYCKECENTHQGKNCPKCGLAARIVLDQSPR